MQRENVWDYPRPPRVEPVAERIQIAFNGRVVADTTEAKRVLETTHPPVYYLPREAFTCALVAETGGSFCEWKGVASYWSLRDGDRIAQRCGWSYPEPTPAFAIIRDHLALYCRAMDWCTVDGERVTPQPGGFYGGWVTSNLKGPFKGGPGTMGW